MNSADKVVVIGPDIDGHGGMAEVLRLHRDYVFSPSIFTYMSSNSRYGTLVGLFNAAKVLLKLPWMRRKKRIVHLHVSTGKSFYRKFAIALWARLWGYQVIVHWHGRNAPVFFGRGVNGWSLRRLGGLSSTFVVLGKYWQEFFEKFVDVNKIHILYNPLLTVNVGTDADVASPVLNVLFLGMIRRDKGVFDLVDAVSALGDAGKNIKVTIGGEGSTAELQAHIDRLGLSDTVHIAGWLDGDNKEKALCDADVVVLPSYAEALPMCLLEGLGHGKALIGTRVGGVEEIVFNNENGMVLNPGDVAGLTQALRSYIDNPELLKEHGLQSFAKSAAFSIDNHKRLLYSLYDQLLRDEPDRK